MVKIRNGHLSEKGHLNQKPVMMPMSWYVMSATSSTGYRGRMMSLMKMKKARRTTQHKIVKAAWFSPAGHLMGSTSI